MIITVTMNPALDKTIMLPELNVGKLHVIRDVHSDAAGKGINVSKTLRVMNRPSMACGLLGGAAGDAIRRELEQKNILTDFVRISGNSRTNIKVVTPTEITELNEPGPEIRPEELEQLMEKLRGYAKPGNLFVVSGSVPKGVPVNIYKEILMLCHEKGCLSLLDASGELLRQGLEAGPDYIKPNLAELKELFGYTERFADGKTMISWVKERAVELRDRGVRMVTVSLGAAGAVFADAFRAVHIPALPVTVSSTIGAGDAMAAAIASGVVERQSFEELARMAMAVSAGACMTEGTKPPTKEILAELLRQK